MKEDFLQFVWKYKLLKFSDLRCTKNLPIEIIRFGDFNQNEGPDFLNAKIRYKNLEWSGNIEIHTHTSDWLYHHHQNHPAYQNIILHVVFNNDRELEYFEKNNIPTLEIKNIISNQTQVTYQDLLQNRNDIVCRDSIEDRWLHLSFPLYYEKWAIEKLQTNTEKIMDIYTNSNCDWEAVLFIRLAYVLGLKINAETFQNIAEQIPFSVIRKLSKEPLSLHAILLGKLGELNKPKDEFSEILTSEYHYVLNKYQLNQQEWPAKYFRLRPAAFPTIRMSFLAQIYLQIPNLFSKIIEDNPISELHQLFREIRTHPYFFNHYSMGKEVSYSEKKMSKNLVNSIFTNALLPLKFAYLQSIGKDFTHLLQTLEDMPKERNSISEKFEDIGFPHQSALDSQALLHLYKNYCSQKKCLHCEIGYQILK